MKKHSIFIDIKKLNRAVFTTGDLCRLAGKSASTVTQSLNNLVREGILVKVYRGVWADKSKSLSPYAAINSLFSSQRVYVSFTSALHLHGIIGQIPQGITLASIGHSKRLFTALGSFSLHKVSADFFKGFDWYRGGDAFLIAEPEKALIDCLYLSTRKKNQFGHFPELDFSRKFSFKKADFWIKKITDPNIGKKVREKYATLIKNQKI